MRTEQRGGTEQSSHRFPIEHSPFEPRSNIALWFPGQDVRKLGMFDAFHENSPGREVLERGNEFLKKELGYNLLDLAEATGDKEQDEHKAEQLRRTEFTQPAVYLLSMAVHNENRHFKKKQGYMTTPELVGGMSMGEGTAATIAGYMDFETGLYFSAMRGKIMQEKSDPTPTSMKALLAGEDDVLRFLGQKKYAGMLELCLINSDSIWVVGGPKDLMKVASAELKERRIKSVDVDTDRAMHGQYVRPARTDFDKLVDSMNFKKPTSTVVSAVTGLPVYSEDQMKYVLKTAFDNRIDNRLPQNYFDAVGIHMISEIGEKGNFAKAVEKTFGAIAAHKFEVAGVTAAVAGGLGVGIYEVVTRHHPKHTNNSHK